MLKKPLHWGVADSSENIDRYVYEGISVSLVIDTSALIAARNADDKNHKKAMALMVPVLKGEYGKVFISDYVFDGAVTLAYIRTGNKKFAQDRGSFARAKPPNLPLR